MQLRKRFLSENSILNSARTHRVILTRSIEMLKLSHGFEYTDRNVESTQSRERFSRKNSVEFNTNALGHFDPVN